MCRWRIRYFARQIMHGAVFAYPTDTIWGLGCHPMNAQAVQRLLKIKQRALSKGLILLASDPEHFDGLVMPGVLHHPQLLIHKEKPVTWIVQCSDSCPEYLSGGRDTIAIRLTRHPLVRTLCGFLHAPLVSTSANLSGKTPVRNAIIAQRKFRDELDFIICGYDTGTNKASEIRHMASGQILRH